MSAALKDLQRIGNALPSVRLLRGDQVKLEATRWLCPGYVPIAMLSLLGGPAGTGKTTIAMAIAAIVTRGGKLPDGSACLFPGNVLIWSGEDAPSVLAARLVAAGADMTFVHFIDAVTTSDDDAAFDPSRDMVLLEEKVAAMPNIRLLIVDPIVSAIGGNTNNNGDTRKGLQSLVRFAQRYDCAVLGITHFTKGTSGREPTERITGSLAFGAAARVVLVVSKASFEDGEEPRRLFMRAKSNVGPDDGGFYYELARKDLGNGVEGQYVMWGASIEGSARDLLADAEGDGQEASATDEAVDHLRDILGAGEIRGREAERLMRADRNEFTQKVVRRARQNLGVTIRRAGAGKEATSYWSLPQRLPETTPAHSGPMETPGVSGHECAITDTSADSSDQDAAATADDKVVFEVGDGCE